MRACLPLALAAGLAGCGAVPHGSGTPGAAPLFLARHPDRLVALEIPPDSRGGREPPTRIPVAGDFSLRRSTGGVHELEVLAPIRNRGLFHFSAPAGMVLEIDGKRARYDSDGGDRTWSLGERTLEVRVEDPDLDGRVSMAWPTATERERALNRRWAPVASDAEFVFRSAWHEHTSRHGVFLPAPGRASFKVAVPPGARLSLEPGLLLPESADLPPSDGAVLTVWVQEGEAQRQVLAVDLAPGRFAHREADLSPWGGREVIVTFATSPGSGGDAGYDYVFLGDPVIASPTPAAPRVLLVFVDTLRPDHLGTWGATRETSPRLDAWAAGGVVFEEARSVAPWTLPSTRTILTGREPEEWDRAPTLPGLAARAGWATGAFVGNVYLSANFGMDRDWGTHFVRNWPRAEEQVDRVLAWLDAHEDQPALALVHFMDVHLPFTEPMRYRRLFAGPAPRGLKGRFNRGQVLSATRGARSQEARRYVVDRYDGAIRYVDDQLGRLWDAMGPDDVVVFFSDHGEEFWEHDGFEHGHTLHDELLRVPLAIRAPGLDPLRVPTPVSLLDLAPTVAELAGIPGGEAMKGRSLVPLVRGDLGLAEALAARPLGIGRPLYGDEQWGVLAGGAKYTTRSGREHLYDLEADPGEQRDRVGRDVVDLAHWRATMGGALDRPVRVAYALQPERTRSGGALTVRLRVPGGVARAWAGDDPTEKSRAEVHVEGDLVEATWTGSASRCREVFVVPAADPAVAGPPMLEVGDAPPVTLDPGAVLPPADGARHVILKGRAGADRVSLTWAVVPEPPEGGTILSGFDAETAGALQALGYVDAEPEPELAEKDDSGEE